MWLSGYTVLVFLVLFVFCTGSYQAQAAREAVDKENSERMHKRLAELKEWLLKECVSTSFPFKEELQVRLYSESITRSHTLALMRVTEKCGQTRLIEVQAFYSIRYSDPGYVLYMQCSDAQLFSLGEFPLLEAIVKDYFHTSIGGVENETLS